MRRYTWHTRFTVHSKSQNTYRAVFTPLCRCDENSLSFVVTVDGPCECQYVRSFTTLDYDWAFTGRPGSACVDAANCVNSEARNSSCLSCSEHGLGASVVLFH